MADQDEGPRRDRFGFEHRLGVFVLHDRHAPWVSFGVHVDWHTPLVQFHVGRVLVSLGWNQWEGKRFERASHDAEGHTCGCRCGISA